jgi:hypothetical protein
VQGVHLPPGHVGDGAPAQHAQPGEPAERGRDQVVPDRHQREQCLLLAALGEQPDAVTDAGGGGAALQRPAVELDGAAPGAVGAVDHPGDLGAARSDEADHPHDLPRAQVQVHGSDAGAVGEAPHPQHDLAGRAVVVDVELLDVAADHLGDHPLRGDLGLLAGADRAAVAEHRDPVGELPDLLHPVADVDQPHPGGPHLVDQREELARLPVRQRGGGFVEHQDPGVLREGAGDLDHLLAADGQPAHG